MNITVSKQEARMLAEALRTKKHELTKKAANAEAMCMRDKWRELLELANDYDAILDKVNEAIGED